MVSPGRSRTTATRAFLVSALAGAVGIGSYGFVEERTGDAGGVETQAQATTTAAGETGETETSESMAPVTFTSADQGSCLTWEVGPDGSISGFEQADCAGPHRFEVSLREDLGTYPTSEFGPTAPMPSQTRQAQLREELCGAATLRYLDGVYDPTGRYSIAPILPPAAAWEKGDRTMLCGLQETDRSGDPILTTGRVADQDQARVFEPGQCVTVDQTNSLTVVDCADPHQLEITAKVAMGDVFPDHTPAVEEQDGHLGNVCTAAAQDYLGGEENLYRITLQPFWTTQKPEAWDGGSRSVNCALVFSRPEGQFAELTGSAREGREHLLIDGAPPAEKPDRRPLRSDAGAGAPGEATGADAGAGDAVVQ